MSHFGGQVLSLLAACQNGEDAGAPRDKAGRGVYNALRCGSLLCNLRRGDQYGFCCRCCEHSPSSGGKGVLIPLVIVDFR